MNLNHLAMLLTLTCVRWSDKHISACLVPQLVILFD